MATGLASKFCGKVEQEEYSQALCKEYGSIWEGTFCRQTFRFEGCTYAEAHDTAATGVAVTDVNNATYTVPLQSKFEDSSHGYGIIPKEVVSVSRQRVSPHMWTLTVTRTGCKAVHHTSTPTTVSGPSWMPY